MAVQDEADGDTRQEMNSSGALHSEGTSALASSTKSKTKHIDGQHKPKQVEDVADSGKAQTSKKHPRPKNKKTNKMAVQESSSDTSDMDSDQILSDTEAESTDSESALEHLARGKCRPAKRSEAQQSKSKKAKAKAKRQHESSKSQHQGIRSNFDTDTDFNSGDASSDFDDDDDDDNLRASHNSHTKQLKVIQSQLQQLLQAYPPDDGQLPSLPRDRQGEQTETRRVGATDLSARSGVRRRERATLARGGRYGNLDLDEPTENPSTSRKREINGQRATKLDFRRVDQVWDTNLHNFRLQDTVVGAKDTQDGKFLFNVRRNFDWDGKFIDTVVDIKSKLLRGALQKVMGNIKGVSLVEEVPKLKPNMLFLYLNDLVAFAKRLKHEQPSSHDKKERRREARGFESTRQQLKLLIKYINKDYADIKKSLHPMLESGLVSFDLLWALWKPGTLAYTTTYGSHDEPRVFKVVLAEKRQDLVKGDYYFIEGKYFENDGKQFGYGTMCEEVAEFRGARKITSLAVYPLKYHRNETQLRANLISRGKKFAALSGVHFKSHHGMAYYKKKRAAVKVNVNGRVMVDPSTHRRINPNYPISTVCSQDHDVISKGEHSEDDSARSGSLSDSENNQGLAGQVEKVKYFTYKDREGKTRLMRASKPEGNGKSLSLGKLEDGLQVMDSEVDSGESSAKGAETADEKRPTVFSDEDYLIASPLVLGFAFAEKLWLEFTVSGIKDIQWNEDAYESLVLEPKTKDIVKALVESHKYHAAESIDDVIQGKGKGLVAVLHGPPGTGKTLTTEGISELLKCPLYMVSAGELGTNSRVLEVELQKILDICHAWGAILLLDEADVFLEKRNMHDIHRNALVSVFLRQLEYFQGIMFLTTNRVETFDDAFQSRIHIALRYDSLEFKAKKAIFKIFIERVRILEKLDMMPFTEEDFNVLARYDLNGRQIKNTVRTAQALAVNKGDALSMSHIHQVLEVQMSFARDLKGGTGYQEAMRSYF